MKITFVAVAALQLLLLAGCGKKTVVTATDEGIARLPKIGNVEIVLDFNAIGGKTVTVANGNDRAVGVYVRKNDEPSIIVFSDGFIAKRGSSTRRGSNFEYGWELRVTVVIYRNLTGVVEAFLDALSADFLDHLQDIWIETKYEEVVVVRRP